MKALLAAAMLFGAQADQQPPVPAPYVVGTDTIESITAKLGKPNSVISNSDGTRVASYVRSRARIKGTSFIPLVGMFAGGAKGSTQILVFIFDADGKLKSYSDASSNTNCNSSIVGASCR